jgi:hypothetical protein
MAKGKRTQARLGGSRSVVTLLGAVLRGSGESRACMAESKLRRRHVFGLSAWFSLPFAPEDLALRAHRRSGGSLASGLAASGAMPPFACLHRGCARTASHNMSIDADPQQQEAASPQMLVVRSFLRYLS